MPNRIIAIFGIGFLLALLAGCGGSTVTTSPGIGHLSPNQDPSPSSASSQPPQCAVLTEQRASSILGGPVSRLNPALPNGAGFCGWQGQKSDANGDLNQVKLTVTPVAANEDLTPTTMSSACTGTAILTNRPSVAADAIECQETSPDADTIIWTSSGLNYVLILYTLSPVPDGIGAELAAEIAHSGR